MLPNLADFFLREGARHAGVLSAVAVLCAGPVAAQEGEGFDDSGQEAPDEGITILEYRVVGSTKLPRGDVERAVYSYLGPGRTPDDVEGARAALEKTYRDKGYQTVNVSVPPQRGRGGIVVLQVTEAPVGRLRVVGSRFFNIDHIKRRAKSLAEGSVPNFEDVQRELIALNRKQDLRVTPEFRPGATPGTVDVDLVVQDTFPFHARVELNNRYSANTTPLRLDITARYDNLWQLGHTIGVGFQIAPQNPDDALVYSAFYMLPVPGIEGLSLMLQGIRQNSDVSTLGGSNVVGNGEIYGGRLMLDLPARPGLFHTLSFGVDYKHFGQDLFLEGEFVGAPVTYFPFVLAYNGFWLGENYQIELDTSMIWSFQGAGSSEVEFDNRRFGATGSFMAFRGSLGFTYDLPLGFQVSNLVQGQAAGFPLVDSEQFSVGGWSTVRGYLESEVLGDSGIAGSFELRSPSLLAWANPDVNEWRVFAFLDWGFAWLNEPLPGQLSEFSLWSFGFGSSIRIFDALYGSVAVGFPQVTQNPTAAGDTLVTFRVWGEL